MEYIKELSDADKKGLEIKLADAIQNEDSEFDESSTVDDYITHVISQEAEIALRRKYELQEHNALQEKIDAMTAEEIAAAMDE